jgi:hypothetical protein
MTTMIRATGKGIIKDDVLKRAKRELMHHINNLTMSDVETTRDLFNNYFNFLSAMNVLPEAVLPKTKKVQKEFTGAVNPIEKLSEQAPAVVIEEVPRYKFEQKLRGGIFQTLDGGYLISERYMREAGLKHNDVCIIKDKSRMPYVFEVVEQGVGKPFNREQFNLCLVEWSRGAFRVARTYTNDLITFGGEEMDFKLSEKDVLDYNISEGDVVDIAFYNNNIDTLKIVTVHNIPKVDEPKPKQEPPAAVAPSKRKAITTTEVSTKVKSLKKVKNELLKGKTIVLIGSHHQTLSYQRAFGKLDEVSLVHLSGDEKSARMESAVKKADIVICSTEHIGHTGSGNARELAKKHNKLYVQCVRDGAQHLITEASKVLEQQLAVV